MGTDPYAAPKARVADIRAPQEDDFLPDGRALPAGRGWSWISGGRALTRQQSLTWIGIFVLFAVIAIVLSFVPLIGALAMYFIGPVLFGGVMLACDDAHEDRQVRVSQLFSAFGSHLGKLLGIGLFSLVAFILIFMIAAAIFGASMAGVLLGMEPDPTVAVDGREQFGFSLALLVLVSLGLSIPVYMALWFSTPLVVLRDLGVLEALRTSFFACLKNILPFLVYGAVMLLLMIVATLPLLLGWLILGPVLLATIYTSYRDVFHAA